MEPVVQEIIPFAPSGKLTRPLFSVSVSAGQPCQAEQDDNELIDLNEHLIRHPQSTYFVRVQGESMLGAGIHDGDMLVVDRALKPRDGSVVVAILNGEFTVKRIAFCDDHVKLLPENPSYPVITVTQDMQFEIWGIVTSVVHSLV